eukprot:scaffold2093_cov425-Prasinococcus_capsulatus_cf.AAC.18
MLYSGTVVPARIGRSMRSWPARLAVVRLTLHEQLAVMRPGLEGEGWGRRALPIRGGRGCSRSMCRPRSHV